MKGDIDKDGKMSSYEKARSKAIEKAVAKKKMSKKVVLNAVGKDVHTVKANKMSDIREAVKKYFDKSKYKDRYEKNQTLDLRIEQGVAMEKGDIEEANRLKELVREREQAYKSWVPTKSTDSWKETLKKKEEFKSFIDTAEDIAGHKLVITTGGSSLNHKLSALDIGKSQLTDEQYDAIGKLAIDMGFRVGDEGDHLHIDDTIRKQEAKAKEDVKKYYEQNPPKDPSNLTELIEKGTKMEIASRKKLTKDNDPEEKRIPTSRVFYNIHEGHAHEHTREERKQKGTFEKYMSTIIPVEEQKQKDAMDKRIRLQDLIHQRNSIGGN